MLVKTRLIELDVTTRHLFLRIGVQQGFETYIHPGSGLSTWNLFVKDGPSGQHF